jgi:hypothetical protein
MGMLLVHFPMKYISLAYHSQTGIILTNCYWGLAESLPVKRNQEMKKRNFTLKNFTSPKIFWDIAIITALGAI